MGISAFNAALTATKKGWSSGMLAMATKMTEKGDPVSKISEEIGRSEEEVCEVLGIAAQPKKEKTYEDAVKRIEQLKAEGKTLSHIAQIVNDEGYRTKTGKWFNAVSVCVLLKGLDPDKEEPKKEKPELVEGCEPPVETEPEPCPGSSESIVLKARELRIIVTENLINLRSELGERRAFILDLENEITRLEALEKTLQACVEVA